MELWLQFIACSVLIVISGAKLSKYGDVIAEKTGLARAWVGLIMLASITSMPELVTGISSVAIVDAPNIAMGDLFGSCVYNLAILAVMDFVNGKKPIFSGVDRAHLLSSGFGVMLLGTAVFSIMLSPSLPSLWHVGIYTPLIVIIYVVGVRAVYSYERDTSVEVDVKVVERYADTSLKRAAWMYVVNALVIIAAATVLPFVAEKLSETTGLGQSFMGSVFVAMTTSLPEFVVSIAAVRIGAQDMAIANMLGSNVFNMLIIAIDDIFYTKGPILSSVSALHGVTGVAAILMTGIVIVGITYPPKSKPRMRLGWGSMLLVAIYLLTVYLLYKDSI